MNLTTIVTIKYSLSHCGFLFHCHHLAICSLFLPFNLSNATQILKLIAGVRSHDGLDSDLL